MLEDTSVSKRLLKSWGKRLAKGQAPVIPVYVNGSWMINVARGNKRALRVVVPSAANKKA